MIIEVNERWRVVSDEHCWVVQERGSSSSGSQGAWRSIAWLPQAHAALQHASELRMRRLQGSIQECVSELRQIHDEMLAAAAEVKAAVAEVTEVA